MGRGHSPPQTSPLSGEGDTHPPVPHSSRPLDIAPSALDLWPHQTEILATPLTLHCIRLTVRPNKCL